MRPIAAALIFVVASLSLAFAGSDERNPRSPFEAVRWDGKSPEVRVGGAFYRLLEIDGVAADDIVAFAEATFGGRYRKRFEEDLEEVLRRMGNAPGDTVALALLPLGGRAAERVDLPAVASTEANRRAIWEAARINRQSASPSGRGEFPKLSPFTAVRWRGRTPEVEVNGKFHELAAIDGTSAEEIVGFCEARYGSLSRKRFEEDLVEVLAALGRPLRREVALTLLPLGGGPPIEMAAVAMTEENRRAIWAAADGSPTRAERTEKAEREDEEDEEFPKLAPFTAVRWSGARPEVEIDGAFLPLLSIDGVGAAEIVAFCESTYGGLAKKRFSEDLVEVLTRMGRAPGETVALELAAPNGGAGRETKRVRMTAENRARVIRANRAEAGESRRSSRGTEPEPPRVEREHAGRVAPEFSFLASRLEAGDGSRKISETDAASDLDELEWLLENRYSYLSRSGVDHRAALDAVRASLAGGLTRESFSIQVRRLLALLGDGHTRVDEAPQDSLPPGYLPFLVAEAGGRLVAFKADRSGFVDASHPYLVSLDGVPVEEWLETAKTFEPRLSPVFHRRQSIRFLRELRSLRRVRGVDETRDVDVVLEGESGKAKKKLTLALASRRPAYGEWPRTQTRRLEGNVGYLRIPEMASDASFLAGLESAMADFRGTRGLVIDVRGNGGGSRDALRTLFPHFQTEMDRRAPRVANVSKYRLAPDDEPGRADGYLADRFLWPVGASAWSDAERTAIRSFADSFRPEWSPEAGFSEWHYLVLSPRPEGRVRHYDKPVVVLVDGDCFSATDVFAGAFKGHRNVTLMGGATGGGSGRSKGHVLSKSGLRVRVSTMASFRPDGKLYDGHGVEPDVVVAPAATDFIGKTDTALAAALRRLK